jgi:imidazolonepropionase-like amidohydrolase
MWPEVAMSRHALLPYAAALAGLSAVAVFTAQPSGQGGAAVTATALTGARIIDGTGAPPVEGGTILIREGRIAAAGPAAAVPVPAGAAVVDMKGMTIVPGLVNAHGHAQAAGQGAAVREDLLRRLRTYAAYGVTTVVSLGQGSETADVVRLRNEQESGALDRARVYTSGPSFRRVASAAEARAAIDTIAKQGVDRIKFHMEEAPNAMSADAYGALIEAAHARGLRVAAHIFTLDEAKGVVARGVDVVAHSVRDRDVDAAFIAAMKARGAAYVPTLTRELSVFVYESTPAFFSDPFFLRGRALYQRDVDTLSDPARQQRIRQDASAQAIKAALAQATRNLKLLSDAGVPIALGTDSGAGAGRWQGYFEHVELEMMVQAGLTPAQALVAATSAAARASGLDHVGTIAAGKAADLLVLRANPLQDIRNTRQIEAVWIGGRRLPLQ